MRLTRSVIRSGILFFLTLGSCLVAQPTEPGSEPRTISAKGLNCVNALIPQRYVKIAPGLYLTEIFITHVQDPSRFDTTQFRAGGNITLNNSIAVRNVDLYFNPNTQQFKLHFPSLPLPQVVIDESRKNAKPGEKIPNSWDMASPLNRQARERITSEFIRHYHSAINIPLEIEPNKDFTVTAEPTDAHLSYEIYLYRPRLVAKGCDWHVDVVINKSFLLREMKLVHFPNTPERNYLLAMANTRYRDRSGNIRYLDIYHPINPQIRAELVEAVTNEMR